jgi:hypothetical protein
MLRVSWDGWTKGLAPKHASLPLLNWLQRHSEFADGI